MRPLRTRRTTSLSRRYLAAAGAVVIAGTCLTACSSSGGGGGGGSVVIGWEGGSGDPLSVTVAKNYFAKETGKKVQIKLFESGPAALSAIASGSLQFMCGLGMPPTISAIAQGVPLQVIWNQERYTGDAGLVVRTSSGISSVSGLKGKTLGLVVGSQSTFEFAKFLQGSGIAQGDVHQLNLSPPQIQSAWTTGRIQAAITWSPVYNYLTSHSGRVLKDDSTLSPNASSYNICVANKSYASGHSSVAVGVAKALNDGVTYTQQHQSAALKIIAKAAGTNVATAKEELNGYQVYTESDQVSSTVLGKGSGQGSSGTAQSLRNNWIVLNKEGFQSKSAPSSVAPYINSTYAGKAMASS